MTILVTLCSILLVANLAYGFPSVARGRRTWPPVSVINAEIESSTDGGAGSWRSTAKEFQSRPKGFDVGNTGQKRLNIAFVVSTVDSIEIMHCNIRSNIVDKLEFINIR